MNRILLVMVMLLMCMGVAVTASGGMEPPKACEQCSMDRVDYARMLIVYADGKSVGVCSLNCAAVEMKKNKGKQVKSLKVADYMTKKVIEAHTATWVIGGKKPGVMTDLPKWAFAKKDEAQKFVKVNGGRVTSFDEALNLALRENE